MTSPPDILDVIDKDNNIWRVDYMKRMAYSIRYPVGITLTQFYEMCGTDNHRFDVARLKEQLESIRITHKTPVITLERLDAIWKNCPDEALLAPVFAAARRASIQQIPERERIETLLCEAEDQGGWPCCSEQAKWYKPAEEQTAFNSAASRVRFYCDKHHENNRFTPARMMLPLYPGQVGERLPMVTHDRAFSRVKYQLETSLKELEATADIGNEGAMAIIRRLVVRTKSALAALPPETEAKEKDDAVAGGSLNQG